MVFTPQTFDVEEILTSTKMAQMDANIDEVRRSHKASAAPPSPTAGTLWLDDSSEPWDWQMYDGSGWISLGKIDPTNDHFSALGPSQIVSAQSLSGNSPLALQQAVLSGLKAWRLVFADLSGNSSATELQLRFYDSGSLIQGSNYSTTRSSGTSRFDLSALIAARIYYGWVDLFEMPNDLFWGQGFIWNNVGALSDISLHYTTALTSVDGFSLFTDSGNFDAGTVAIYTIPEWQHT